MRLLRFSWSNTPQTLHAVGSGSPFLSRVFSVNAVSSDMMIQSNRGSGVLADHSRNQLRLMMPLSSGSISSPCSSWRPMRVPSYCSSCLKNDFGRFAELSYVDPRTMMRPSCTVVSLRMMSRGLGVVVQSTCGTGPRRRPICIMSHVSSA